MQQTVSFQRFSYAGLDLARAFDVIYGGHFQHRLHSARQAHLEHQRLALGNTLLESGCYDFPVIAHGVMPEDVVCVGLMADGAELTRYNTATIDNDEIQLYPPGAELLYHAAGASRWINLSLPRALLQNAVVAHAGRPLELPGRHAMSIRLRAGGRARLVRLAEDALALGRNLAADGLPAALADGIRNGLADSYAAELVGATLADGRRSNLARQNFQLVLACERLALTEDDLTVELDALAHRCGYGRRALELIFKRTVGMPPGRWFLNIRLNGVMRDLLGATAHCRITEVASRWGFRHFSRFAYQYRRAFGELPSETLRRAQNR
ncbi:helix-turn-helix transcriptional regulator [Pseudomonas citronellolis]|uniref:helix-turn-helix transcriptional regulator n=1 Tax=Pseudomonas citronellolis TaxID=53408 RepID=UPI0023E3E3F7|nr:helix-turn-helix transcriptional regulator [Pseudomonas citronellolis]MDF3933242.1 helix-turn-helix transcriptional regulator [Pseudomonas citronellolis]